MVRSFGETDGRFVDSATEVQDNDVEALGGLDRKTGPLFDTKSFVLQLLVALCCMAEV